MSRDEPLAGLFCLRCDYDLTGLQNRRCPECGAEFDPEHVADVIRSSPKPIRVSTLLARLLWPVVLIPLVIVTAKLGQELFYGMWALTVQVALISSAVTVEPLHAAIRIRSGRSGFERTSKARGFLSFLILFVVQCLIAIAAAYAALWLAYA